jgi:hypothetical protein
LFCISPGGWSAALGRTVRDHHMDGPRHTADGPLNTNKMTQPAPPHADGPYHILGRSVPRPRTVREQLVPRGLSATSLRTVRQTSFHQKALANRIKMKALKNTRRTRRTPRPKAPRELSAPSSRTFRQVRKQQPESQLENTLPPILPRISQTVEALEERFGEDVKRP